MSLVIIPQAMPAIVPPMISLWMNVVKNSSLAIAIGYPDLVAVFMQTSLNQAGHGTVVSALNQVTNGRVRKSHAEHSLSPSRQ